MGRWATAAVREEVPKLAADTSKAIAVAVHERLEEIPGLQMVGLVHDEVLLLAPEEYGGRAEGWLTGIMEGQRFILALRIPHTDSIVMANAVVRSSRRSWLLAASIGGEKRLFPSDVSVDTRFAYQHLLDISISCGHP